MKHRTENVFSEEQTAAKNELPIKAGELIMEIYPLLEDYFVGEIECDGTAINYKLPNGQRFRISATAQ